MILSLIPTSLAADLTGNDTVKTVEEAGYSFRISEKTDEYGRITRYIKSEDYESRQTYPEFTERWRKPKLCWLLSECRKRTLIALMMKPYSPLLQAEKLPL